jgi:glutamate-1-semialdehyde 2,1-aminomutase
MEVNGPEGRALWSRADRVLPGGGIYLSRSARFGGEGVLPGFIAEAHGCRVSDADGKEYIDFICANGPNLLGYGHSGVQDAYLAQAQKPASTNFFSPLMVELAETLVDRHPGLDWAVLAKTGSEVLTLAGRVARQATGRPLIVAFTQAYHGSDAELSPWPPPGVPPTRLDDVVRVPWNDVAALRELGHARAGEIAAILLNALDQNSFQATQFAAPEFIASIEEIRRRNGVAVILDDVRQGFRMHPEGSHRALGLEPDLLCLGKGLGNGHSVSALLGREALREGARGIMFTSSLHFEQPPMRAAMATLDAYDKEGAFDAMLRAGLRLRDGFHQAARETGHAIHYSGPPTMPTLLFENDPDHRRIVAFSREAARRGALFHSALNWFLCAAHDDDAIDQALEIARASMKAIPAPAREA